MLQRCGIKTAEMEEAGHDNDWLAVPAAPRQSEHSLATSSAQEVEDCEDLEVGGIDSETNVVGMTCIDEAGREDGESSAKLKGLEEARDQGDRGGSDSESDDNADVDRRPDDVEIEPASATAYQSLSQTVGARKPGNSDDHSDNADDIDHNDTPVAKPTQATSRQGSVHMGGLSDDPGQHRRPDPVGDDEDDFDDDDDNESIDMAIKPTFSPFSALSAGGDHLSVVNKTNSSHIHENKDGVENTCLTATKLTASAAAEPERLPVSKGESLYGAQSSDKDSFDELEDDDLVDDVCAKNSAAIAATAASDSFNDIFTKNLDSHTPSVKQEDTGTSGGSSGFGQEHPEVLNPVQEDDDSELEENIETLGNENGSKLRLNTVKSLGETGPSHCRADGNKARNQVRICSADCMYNSDTVKESKVNYE